MYPYLSKGEQKKLNNEKLNGMKDFLLNSLIVLHNITNGKTQ